MADIFDAYALADAWDEMFERPGEVRTAYEPVLAALQPIEPSELRFRADQMARAFTDRGVTYAFAGEERPWPLDLVPRILDALDSPCVCSQVLTHEWDEHTQTYRQRWTVPEHFTACAKHWPATTGTPPPGTIADRGHEGGPLTTPAARVAAERERSRAERQRLLWAGDGDYTIARAVDSRRAGRRGAPAGTSTAAAPSPRLPIAAPSAVTSAHDAPPAFRAAPHSGHGTPPALVRHRDPVPDRSGLTPHRS